MVLPLSQCNVVNPVEPFFVPKAPSVDFAAANAGVLGNPRTGWVRKARYGEGADFHMAKIGMSNVVKHASGITIPVRNVVSLNMN